MMHFSYAVHDRCSIVTKSILGVVSLLLLSFFLMLSAEVLAVTSDRQSLYSELSHLLYAESHIRLRPGFAPSSPHKRHGTTTISLDQALSLAEKKYGGKALSGKMNKNKGSQVYRIKLLSNNGRVSIVFVSAESGRVFKAR